MERTHDTDVLIPDGVFDERFHTVFVTGSRSGLGGGTTRTIPRRRKFAATMLLVMIALAAIVVAGVVAVGAVIVAAVFLAVSLVGRLVTAVAGKGGRR